MLATGVQLIIACHTGTRHQKKKKKNQIYLQLQKYS